MFNTDLTKGQLIYQQGDYQNQGTFD